MRKILQYLLKRPLTWMGNYLSAAPKREEVFHSLSTLYENATKPGANSCISLDATTNTDKFIIFSDQHKGNKTWADDFAISEGSYIAALTHYYREGFSFINLGDCEELWKFKATDILPSNQASLAAESAFQPNRYYKTFGNHDIIWKNKIDVNLLLKDYFQMPLPVYEGVVIQLKHSAGNMHIFMTHGHQGDAMSDNNAFSTWVVAHLWMPLQRYLRININVPSQDFRLRNKHNQMMHEWSSSKENLVLITGHTHQPVFASGRYFNHPNNVIEGTTDAVKPCYFNTGCCCFSDGDITGLEIEGEHLRLIKWHYDKEKETASRKVLEEVHLTQLCNDLGEC